ncbi:DNA polymerase III subunit gamma/tau [Paludibacter sp. 221]|uniref:DNA polymerase III subunit gamma/tau n=1 Tax=Paludibacter sp. 221 TaxID=2302939 RepID=UPI0013D4C8A8|nr:DNA polymerase III subunit gamma/tau [Paludibacter sp. 221]NDV47641.1 DNA polymerase III subunit gamma/tau [Paludibacter sp. 221]
MDNFIVSARKYRPSTFNSVVGQSSLTTTLKNAITNNHLAHAYLFCGPRGVGKTTCARIFAKIINCQNLTSEFEACNQCESCVAFNEGRSYNIHELDAASNNGVDDIRNLIDQVRIPPQIGKYSVYIIDEVHMLSQGAFNAFLKTLEEPPAHAIFILATTEKHKIIPTILSRTQIYDFNRITIADTVDHLKYVASQEGVDADENALTIIAQKSDGGMRDALSIFDQIVSFSGNKITYQDVITNLNVLDYEYYFQLVDAFLKNEVSKALLIFNEILDKGFDAHHFIGGLSTHLRDVLVCKDPQTISLLEVGADIRERYKKQAQDCPTDFLFQALKITNDCDLNYRISKNKRLLVELALIRLSQLTNEKKKQLSEENPIPLQKIAVEASSTDTPKTTIRPEQKQEEKTVQAPVSMPNNTVIPRVESVPKQEKSAPKAQQLPPSISITAKVVAAPQETYAKAEATETLNNDFTDEDLTKVWLSFADTIPDEKRLISYINSNLPKRIPDTPTFEVWISNSMQEKEVNGFKRDILNYLRSNLKNSYIDMIINMNETIESYKILSPEDKYKQMAAQNPALIKLRTGLNFEID